MLQSLKSLQTPKSDSSRLLNFSASTNDFKPLPTLPDAATSSPTSTIRLRNLEEDAPAPQSIICRCVYQQPDFCPYCDYEQSMQLEASTSVLSSTSPSSDKYATDGEGAQLLPNNSTSRRRKLRKVRPDPQHLRYEALKVEAVIAARPDSVLSVNSRTPLLNANLPSKPDYLPISPVPKRTANKLEKRDKRRRSISVTDAYSTLGSRSQSSNSLRLKVVRSKSFLTPKPTENLGPRPSPISSSIDTDTLVSLAWTGDVTSPARAAQLLLDCPDGSDFPSHGASQSNSNLTPDSITGSSTDSQAPSTSSSVNQRRSVLRKQKDPATQIPSPQRPWTLAMVITDDGITDEGLVHDLESMRIKEPVNGVNGGTDSDSYPLGLGPPPQYQTQLYDSYAEYPPEAGEIVQEVISPSDSSWNAARQVLLLCREFVRTERRYLRSLKMLITNGTNTPPPALMLPYLPGLIAASEKMLEITENNPSVQGVSEALLACEASLTQAFVNWCTVVGQFFHPDDGCKSDELPDTPSSAQLAKPRSRATSLRTHSAESGLSIVIPEPNKIRKNPKGRPTVRDLAILPTQRVMRYVLLFKELYTLTPTTLPSFAIVQKAFQVAESIARTANEAQGHSAFKQLPTKISMVSIASI